MRSGTSNNELFPTEAWRLLLPNPAPSTIVAVGSGPVSNTARRVLGAVDHCGFGQADLVAADSADLETLQAIRRLLAPGGVAYIEVPASARRGAGPIANVLDEAGFDDMQFYALSPGPGRWDTSWWIPIGAPTAVRFVAQARIRHRVPRRSLRIPLANFVNRVAAAFPRGLSSRPWLLHPTRQPILCVVAVVEDDDGHGDPTPGLVHDAIAATLGLEPAPHGPKALMRAGGSSTDQPMLLVADKAGNLVAVVKAPVRSEEIEAATREAQILTELGDLLPPNSGVPMPFTLPGRGDMQLAGQTFVDGDRLSEIVEPDTFAIFGQIVTKWAIELAKSTIVPIGPRTLVAHLDSIVAELRETIGSELADRAVAMARPGLEYVAFGVAHHRDLGPWNVHYGSGGIGVIDWPDAVRSGPPLADLTHHLVHLALCANDGYDPDQRGDVLEQVVDRSEPLGGLIGKLEDDYARSVGVPLDAVSALRILTWLIDIGRQDPERRADGLYLDLLKAELNQDGPQL